MKIITSSFHISNLGGHEKIACNIYFELILDRFKKKKFQNEFCCIKF